MNDIVFNKPFLTGKELLYIEESVKSGKISGDGIFTKKCHQFFENKYGLKKALLTTSCTDALEMAAILIDTKPGDEIIVPSYTFVSTANAFVLRGANIRFCDSRIDHPGMDEDKIEALVTEKTKAIVPMHYAGMACDMDKIMRLADKYNLFVIEDAALAIDSFYKAKPLGSFGHMAAFSFHETKNIISGEGGMLAVNDPRFIERAEIIREKGTNRSKFFRGEVDKYNWVDLGSSFLPSDIIAAFLYAQLERMEEIQTKRKLLWNRYFENLTILQNKGYIQLPKLPHYATNNGHIFYILCKTEQERDSLIAFLRGKNIMAVFHYLPLHNSPFHKPAAGGQQLPEADYYAQVLIRLPMFYELIEKEIDTITDSISEFFGL
jgi:dTDP-4-amino-4,6-dideoxygalactose transaminase